MRLHCLYGLIAAESVQQVHLQKLLWLTQLSSRLQLRPCQEAYHPPWNSLLALDWRG
jgi:hypothetical protein